MPTFSAGDIVRAPFPYTDRDTDQVRPALVVSAEPLGDGRIVWLLMITSASHRPWPGDVAFGGSYSASGLPAPSVVRVAKIATVETSRLDRIGRASAPIWDAVGAGLSTTLGLAPPTAPPPARS